MVQVMLEVDRLPDIDCHRPGGGRVVLSRAQEAVETVCHCIEAARVRAIDPGRPVSLASLQDYFPGQQEFTAANHLYAGEEPFRVVGVVSTPPGVHSPDLSVGEGESGHSNVQQRGCIGAWPALAAR